MITERLQVLAESIFTIFFKDIFYNSLGKYFTAFIFIFLSSYIITCPLVNYYRFLSFLSFKRQLLEIHI